MQWNEFRSHIRHFTQEEQARIHAAFKLGEKMHAGQSRKSGEPYFSHPVAVASMLVDLGADVDTVVAALLHDTVEDTDLTLGEIDKQFDGSVRPLIEGVTKLSAEEFADRPNLNEQVETLRKMFTLMESDIRIMVIKLIDRLHNMQTVEFLPSDKQRALAAETNDVYVKVADLLCMQDTRDELKGLCLAVLEPEQFAKLARHRSDTELRAKGVLKTMRDAMSHTDSALAKTCDIHYEHKDWEDVRLQVDAWGSTVTGLSDLTAVFVCADVHDCYRVMGLLHQLWQRETLSFQDYINSPIINGYRGLHTTVILEDGTKVRCKIRTQEMHDYARRGITTQCFTSETHRLIESLPWIGRISPLSKDTKNRSEEFLQALQSDILDESIVIHGPGDRTVSLPKGSTALDGIFYVFGNEALHVEAIKVNGKDAHFSSPLPHAASIEGKFARRRTVEREWLTWTKTGVATAKIRQALAGSQSEDERVAAGKAMMQESMRERKKGFIEEYGQGSIQPSLQRLGYRSMEELYKAISDGRLQADKAVDELFGNKKFTGKKKIYVFDFRPVVSGEVLAQNIQEMQKAYGSNIRNIHYENAASTSAHIRLRALLSDQEKEELTAMIRRHGAAHIGIFRRFSVVYSFLIVSLLVLLWGFDPVFGHILVTHYGVHTVDLTIVRFLSLTALSALLFLWLRARSKLSETRLHLRNISLWVSAALLICVSLFTYLSLQQTLPSHYSIPMTAAGLLLTSIVNRGRWITLLATWSLLVIGIIILVISSPDWPLSAQLFTCLAVAAFSAFCIVSERYKKQEFVASRVAQYFFVLSLLCCILTLALLPFSTLATATSGTTGLMVAFSVVFVGLPYYIYYYLLSHRELDYILRYSFVIIFATLLGQGLFVSPVHGLTIVSALVVTAGACLPLIKSKI